MNRLVRYWPAGLAFAALLLVVLAAVGAFLVPQLTGHNMQAHTVHNGLGGKSDPRYGVDPCKVVTPDQIGQATEWKHPRVTFDTAVSATPSLDYSERDCHVQADGGRHLFIVTWIDDKFGATGSEYEALSAHIGAVVYVAPAGFPGAQGALYFGPSETLDPASFTGVVLTANGVVVEIVRTQPYHDAPSLGRTKIDRMAVNAIRYLNN